MSITVLLADDHRIFREGVHSLLEKEPDMEVVGEADTGRSAVDMAGRLRPHLVVMDLIMPGLNGIDATRQVVSSQPGVKVLALSMHSDRRFVAGALSAGASGFLLKDCAAEELLQAIRTVSAGHTYLSPLIAGMVAHDYVTATPDAEPSPLSTLSLREREVLQLIAEGRAVKEIAGILQLSVKTVETHRQQIMTKLDIRTVPELTKFAVREGLTAVE